ncbi:MAG: DNA-directed RNA polymerase subunit D [Candidatus Aenigmatarchaeota archaeon]
MEVKILERNSDEIKIKVTNIVPSIAAMIRRSIIAEIPTMAIEWVDFYKNDSVLPDEIVAHRLGLIPLSFDKKIHTLPNKCECGGKGCPRCQVKLYLYKKGPGYVYSGDLKTSDESVKPIYDKIPITYLNEDEEIELEAIAQLGLGKEHAKWQAGNCGYSYNDSEFIFNIETTSYYKPEELFEEAINVIIEKLEELKQKIS